MTFDSAIASLKQGEFVMIHDSNGRENEIDLVDCKSMSREEILSESTDADAIIFCFADVDAELLEKAKKCKVASRYGIGVDNIDIKKCTELGIVVTNIPDYCLEEVADHAIGMILSLNRRITEHWDLVRNGGWHELNLDIPVLRLSEATLGIVGFGRIGKTIPEGDYNEDEIHIGNPVSRAVRLKSCKKFVNIRSLKDIKENLRFIKDKKFWGRYIQGGITQISEEEYEFILAYALSK